MKQIISNQVLSYSRVGDFQVVVNSAVYPSVVKSGVIFFSLQDTRGCWTTESSLSSSKVCAPGQVSKLNISKPAQFGEVKSLKIKFGGNYAVDQYWFVDLITVGPTSLISTEVAQVKTSYFPLRRWVCSNRTNIFTVNDCLLPQSDPNSEQRKIELDELDTTYHHVSSESGQPLTVTQIPIEDDYDYMPQRAELVKLKTRLKKLAVSIHLLTGKLKSLDDIKKLYAKSFPLPQVSYYWKSDFWFAKMRLQGANPTLLKLCHKVPEKFAVKEEDVLPFLEEKSLEDCIRRNKIFITDLEVLKDGVYGDGKKMWAPMALFYLNKARKLLPIAVQLNQKPGNDNPVFLPTDNPNTWNLAKIYYNCAEAVHHECFTHLGNIHLLLDAVWITSRKNISPSHPIFKLMAPHFFRLLGNNYYGISALFRPEGIFDEIFQGKSAMAKSMLKNKYSFEELNPKLDILNREVGDHIILPDYPYRDDILLFYYALKKYVTAIVSRYYDTQDKLMKDDEIQKWRKMMGTSQENGGCGISELPGSNTNGFSCKEELIEVVTTMISISSIKHAAVNYCQYEMFAYAPNSPLSMRKPPPTSKKPVTEAEILKCLPKKKTMLMSMVFLTVLSYIDGNPLGEFDYEYLYHPDDVKARKTLVMDLNHITEEIDMRNVKRTPTYDWLLLDYVRNSANM